MEPDLNPQTDTTAGTQHDSLTPGLGALRMAIPSWVLNSTPGTGQLNRCLTIFDMPKRPLTTHFLFAEPADAQYFVSGNKQDE